MIQAASMGPRSYERGKGTYDEAGDVVGRSFNGAAFLRTRKALGWKGKLVAAVMLQWGRVPTNAEGPRHPLAIEKVPTSLQWGRVPTNAERAAD